MPVWVSQRAGTCIVDADAATDVGHASVDQAGVEQPSSRSHRVSDLAALWSLFSNEPWTAKDAMESHSIPWGRFAARILVQIDANVRQYAYSRTGSLLKHTRPGVKI